MILELVVTAVAFYFIGHYLGDHIHDALQKYVKKKGDANATQKKE